jgi:hypothetical protein
MGRHRLFFFALCVITVLALPIAAQLQDSVDQGAIAKIRDEGLERSNVMDIASHLTDGFGPRLTGSPNIKAAGQWAASKMTSWGLSNVKLESWGPFGRGWTNQRFYAAMVTPYPFTLIGHSKAWAPGTKGVVKGEAILASVTTQDDAEKYHARLRGKIVLNGAPRELAALFQPAATRLTDKELETMANPPQRGGQRGQGGQPGQGGQRGQRGPAVRQLTAAQLRKFFLEEGVLAVIEDGRASGGNTVVQSGGDYAPNAAPVPVQIVLSSEHYGIIARDLKNDIPVTLELNVENKFFDGDLNSFNVIGEIPGRDKADEVVMLGAHFDSWASGTGATDNAAGSAIMMEAMRILKATGLPLRRTVRIGLWTGEEEGLLGSRAYVKEHLAERETMQLKPDHAKFSVYFNVDNGTGQIRGVYMQGNEAARPLFDSWMQPFKDFGMTTLTIRPTDGTDHLNFDSVGLPGFQFIQDPIEYDTRTHHTSMDVYERIQAKDMMQNAVIVAAFAYQAANRNELFPRKPLPAPQPAGQRGGRGE